jgi:Ca2+-binding EF-hand superfamily protein
MVESLTEDQINMACDAFKVLDIDNDGSILTNELEIWLNSLGFEPTNQELEYMIGNADPSGNGIIDFRDSLILLANFV